MDKKKCGEVLRTVPRGTSPLSLLFLYLLCNNQRESNMHRIEVHHFASRFAPNFPVGENSGFMQEIL